MIRCIRHVAAFSLLLLLALLANAARVQVLHSAEYDANPANRRAAIARWGQPRGDIWAGGERLTGSVDTGEGLRYERTYPDGELYAPVTGYASQLYGTTMLEDTEDAALSGRDTRLAPLPLWGELTRSLQPGGQVHTTIEPAAQRAGYAGLRGRKGAVVALEPSTGRILALVSSPSYDPGLLSGNSARVKTAWRRLLADPRQPLLNRAIRQTYPPGSTFKIVTAAAALDTGVVTDIDAPTRTPSPYNLVGTRHLLRNESAGCADAPLREAFAVSCNTVFAKLGATVGTPEMARTAAAFGFDDEGPRIPSPALGSVFGDTMDAAQVALSSIGQFDTRATPLQMASVAATVANGGIRMRPYLVDEITDGDGDVVARGRPEPLGGPVVPGYVARLLQQMMVDTVTGGTATRAAIPGALVGGKTGTAQHGVDNSRKPYAWFVSWAQAPDDSLPAVAVAVVVEDAEARRSDISGGGSAAPIARAVMEAALS
ncbi:Penicillin-binding protein A [Streptomyces sp. RB5]|uniref:Penicillin-binding protein A n=1 Tax=Streptomyces smaragdinus TaxID=2585196 RepID=A0A7K0CJX1_9ACTN|nr:penicillin-binding protein 2 [Streptomyces smaragdinus]MQY13691.1 Penicillin-binding protein A [Streptomyces smaragdinus]